MKSTAFEGLIAQTYDAFHREGAYNEVPLFLALCENRGEPILEPGCGTGRFLLPLARAGRKIEGFDHAEGMLSICRQKAQAEGLAPVVFEGSFTNFGTNKKYGYICLPYSTLRLIVEEESLRQFLMQVAAHLDPGGKFIFEVSMLSRETVVTADGCWRHANTIRAKEGIEIAVSAANTIDMAQLIETRRIRFERFKHGQLERTELQIIQYRWYSNQEIEYCLASCGFSVVARYGNLEQQEFRPGDWSCTFVARL